MTINDTISMNTGGAAPTSEFTLQAEVGFPRKGSVVRRFPEVEVVEGEFKFVTESRKPSTASVLLPPVIDITKDVTPQDDYWAGIRAEWRVSEESVETKGQDDVLFGSSTTVQSTHAPASSLSRLCFKLPSSPCTAHVQARFRDGPFETIFPGSTEYDERRKMTLNHHIIEDSELPGWYATVEPQTLARSLFYFGFLFMPFWIINIIIMMVSLQPTPDWEEAHTTDGLSAHERAKYLQWVRATELKWCRRSLFALVGFTLIWTTVIIIFKFSVLHTIGS